MLHTRMTVLFSEDVVKMDLMERKEMGFVCLDDVRYGQRARQRRWTGG